MIRASALLTVAALAMLVAGAASASLALVYASIAVSILAAVTLGAGVLLRRRELFGTAAVDSQPGWAAAGPAGTRAAGGVIVGVPAADRAQARPNGTAGGRQDDRERRGDLAGRPRKAPAGSAGSGSGRWPGAIAAKGAPVTGRRGEHAAGYPAGRGRAARSSSRGEAAAGSPAAHTPTPRAPARDDWARAGRDIQGDAAARLRDDQEPAAGERRERDRAGREPAGAGRDRERGRPGQGRPDRERPPRDQDRRGARADRGQAGAGLEAAAQADRDHAGAAPGAVAWAEQDRAAGGRGRGRGTVRADRGSPAAGREAAAWADRDRAAHGQGRDRAGAAPADRRQAEAGREAAASGARDQAAVGRGRGAARADREHAGAARADREHAGAAPGAAAWADRDRAGAGRDAVAWPGPGREAGRRGMEEWAGRERAARADHEQPETERELAARTGRDQPAHGQDRGEPASGAQASPLRLPSPDERAARARDEARRRSPDEQASGDDFWDQVSEELADGGSQGPVRPAWPSTAGPRAMGAGSAARRGAAGAGDNEAEPAWPSAGPGQAGQASWDRGEASRSPGGPGAGHEAGDRPAGEEPRWDRIVPRYLDDLAGPRQRREPGGAGRDRGDERAPDEGSAAAETGTGMADRDTGSVWSAWSGTRSTPPVTDEPAADEPAGEARQHETGKYGTVLDDASAGGAGSAAAGRGRAEAPGDRATGADDQGAGGTDRAGDESASRESAARQGAGAESPGGESAARQRAGDGSAAVGDHAGDTEAGAGRGRSGAEGTEGADAAKGAARGGDAGRAADGGAPPDDAVTIVPGVTRYHRRSCILIRFLSDGDLETMPRREAEATGLVPCKACQPDKTDPPT